MTARRAVSSAREPTEVSSEEGAGRTEASSLAASEEPLAARELEPAEVGRGSKEMAARAEARTSKPSK
jgi:hypothetical protein